MARIELEGVKKSFNDLSVISELTLAIAEGEFFTFVGPSGCGKTTVLNIIAGLEDATAGRVLFDGEEINLKSPVERDVAMVFQSYALYPHMNVFDNIAFPLRVRGESKRRIQGEVERVAGVLAISDKLRKLPRELSGGQRQRVALGRAIVRRPRVFLMDEPLSNLDQRLRVEMRAELKKLHAELKITTVYVTHDQEEAMSLSDRVAVFFGGEVQQCAPPMELYEMPANLFVAGFIGSPPMNLIDCEVTGEKPFKVSRGEFTMTPLVLKSPVGKKVVVGIRPDNVLVSPGPVEGGLEARVEVVEPVGSQIWVDLSWNGCNIKGKVPAGVQQKDLLPGRAVYIRLDMKKAHLFDHSTGTRL